jgi:hypothetical protein
MTESVQNVVALSFLFLRRRWKMSKIEGCFVCGPNLEPTESNQVLLGDENGVALDVVDERLSKILRWGFRLLQAEVNAHRKYLEHMKMAEGFENWRESHDN